MVRIKRLILDGFKTFGKRTVIDFGKDLNVIVGPNGSGKSNISDAICFVLGRSNARTLRAERITDFIYHGGKAGKPKKSCEVSIIFDNSDGKFPVDSDEVKITRIVRMEGSSIYKINDKVKTRQEIISLLSKANINPNGYNIVMQDDITGFITLSPNDKRLIIEEVAGISVYREKKEKAEKELQDVEQRIKDASIILEERRQSLKELETERSDALKYKEIQDEIKALRYNLLRVEKEKKLKQIEKIRQGLESANKAIDEKNKLKEEYKQKTLANKKEISEISQEIENKGEKEQIEINRLLEELRIKKATKNSDLNNYKEQIRNIEAKEENLEVSIKELKENLTKLQARKSELDKLLASETQNLNKINTQLDEFRKSLNLESLDDLNKRLSQIDDETESLNTQIQQKREQLQSFIREKDRVAMELENIDAKIAKIDSLKKQHKKEIEEIEELKKQFKNLTFELANLMNEDSMIANKLIKYRRELSELKEQQVKLNIKSLEIKEMINKNRSLKGILDLKSSNPGIFGTIAELGSVDKKYELALSLAAGSRINYVVVDTDETAAFCIKYLKKNKLGAVSFIPLNKIKANSVPESLKEKVLGLPGVIGFAIDLIRFDSRFKKAFEFVFGDTLVVDNIDTARRIGVGTIRMVTLDGDLVERSGVMFGGHISNNKAMPKFSSDDTKQKLDEINRKIDQISNEISSLEQKKDEIREKIDEIRNKKAEIEGEIVKREKSLYIEDSDLEADAKKKEELIKRQNDLEELIAKKQSEINQLLKKIVELKTEKQKIKAQVSQISDPSKMAELRAYEESRESILNRINSLKADLSKIETNLEVVKRDLEESNKIKQDLDKQKAEFENLIKQASKEIEELDEEIKEKEEVVKKFYSDFKVLFQKRSDLENQNQELENKIYELDAEIKGLNDRLTNLKMKETQLQTEIDNLQRAMDEFGEMEIINSSESEMNKRLAELVSTVEGMGAINLKAIEVYDEAKKEYEDLQERLEKLNKEREDVLKLISEIEEKRKEIFLKTFEKINQYFQEIFKKLAPKGEAFLELEDPENPFNGGLRLQVRLNKSNFIELRSLSGGEKALTALSFLFALQEYEPSGFYILDEVDAPLDPMNSKELGKWIKEYSKRAQYIVITHNDNVVSQASYLFGVSMDKDKNLSKIVSLEI